MVFYIVAVNDKEGNPKAIETKIKTRCPSIANDNRPGRAEIHEVHVSSPTKLTFYRLTRVHSRSAPLTN